MQYMKRCRERLMDWGQVIALEVFLGVWQETLGSLDLWP